MKGFLFICITGEFWVELGRVELFLRRTNVTNKRGRLHPAQNLTRLRFSVFFFFFFFFTCFNFRRQLILFTYCSHTVYGIHNHLIQKKKNLKMDLMILFTHLKIILLQYFQFSIFNKINCIEYRRIR